MEEQLFKIDFFELAALAEACIPPTTIGRAFFWHKLIDTYYYQLSENQRAKLRNWLSKNYAYERGLEKKDDDVMLFDARYNPDNQYLVTQERDGEIQESHTFLHKGRYFTSSRRSLVEDYIAKIEKL